MECRTRFLTGDPTQPLISPQKMIDPERVCMPAATGVWRAAAMEGRSDPSNAIIKERGWGRTPAFFRD